jgi:hypothetical protein
MREIIPRKLRLLRSYRCKRWQGIELASKHSLDVPEQALKCVDAFIAKDCLVSQLLPMIAQLCGYASSRPRNPYFELRVFHPALLQFGQAAKYPK